MTTMATVATRIPLRLLGEEHAFEVAAPSGPSALTAMLPAARALCDQATAVILDRFRDAGQPVSCRVGCFACCLHLVAVTLPEALDLAAWVASLPAAHQAEVRARFAHALDRLEREGLLDTEAPPGRRTLLIEEQASHSQAVHELSRLYYRLQIPCPLLEGGRCAAYERRPTVCREHHVTSPAENCSRPEQLLVHRVETRVEMTGAIARTTGRLMDEQPRTIPLVLALEWAEANSDLLAGTFDGARMMQTLIDEVHSERECEKFSRALPDRAVPAEASEGSVEANIDLTVAGRRLRTRIEVPAGPTPLIQLLPIARRLSQVSLSAATEDAEAEGMQVSCKAGCGACCRQLVPLSATEARQIQELVQEMPAPRRAIVEARFASARQRLAEAGLLLALQETLIVAPRERLAHADAYFALGVPCPFLENESCSIYEERPLICREYVVVSPPECCARPGWGGVKVLVPPLQVWRAFSRADAPRADGGLEWIPLVLAPQWAQTHAEETTHRSGPQQLQALFSELTGKAVPPPPA
jgi:Fe-S-cluster containining protein